MLVLGLDTSSPAVSAALVGLSEEGTELLAEHVVVDGRRHGELLAAGVREVLGGRRPDALVVGAGPGPFTGLRVGLVTAVAMADGLGVPAYAVCSLDGLGVTDGLAVSDARRREVYWARYAGGRRVDGPHVTAPAALPQAATVVGAGAVLHGRATAAQPLHPSVLELVRCAADRALSGAPSDPLTPLYLRRPDAVEPGAGKRVTA